ncbi:MAG: carboxy terminal-processing peptidase [Pirellulales bacterium]|nr:carboxy terminal-processing peptidase [Pirellulales bacterium]
MPLKFDSIRTRFMLPAVLLLSLTILLPSTLCADPVGPTQNDRYITISVVQLLKMKHLSRHALDDEISQRFMKTYLKMLDPGKMYFYQSDVDEFMKRKLDLDDMASHGDISFGYKVYKRFLQRVDERVAMAMELLQADHDFTIDEEIMRDREDAAYPKTPEEARELWRKRVKYDLLVLRTDKKKPLTGKEAIEKLEKRYASRSRRMHQYSNDDLLEMYLTAMTSSYDPHTTYMSPSTLENFEIAMRLELEGIGASLQSDDDGTTVIKKIIPGGAADKNGELKVEDRITGVGQGDEGEIVDIVNMKLTNVVKLIRGERGTVVRLQVQPADDSGEKIVKIARERIELKDSEARGEVIEEGKKPDGSPYKIGVIDLPSFYMDMEGARRGLPDFKSTTRDVRVILDDFKAKGVDAVVLDLRMNGGGSLTEAINLTGLFIDRGPVVQVKGLGGYILYEDHDPGVSWDGPLVVLTSKFSASASEILAGAIQDYQRGLIVGDHSTHGKGTVQSLHDLNRALGVFNIPTIGKMGALKITMQQFYRPNGDSTQNRGVLADVELPSITSYWDVGEADLDYPVAFDRLESTDFRKLHDVSKPLCKKLQELSQKRCESSKHFQKVMKNIEKYKEQKDRKTVTLNEAKFRAEREEMNDDDEKKKKAEELNDPNRPVVKRDDYMNEALAVTLDFLRLGKGLPPAQHQALTAQPTQ